MTAPIVYGPAYSTYARTVCMTLQEKNVAYKRIDVDVIKGANREPGFLQRQPFGKVPTFESDGFALYETSAIVRYIDEAFDGPSLQPKDVRDRARMNQMIGIIDSYAYGSIVGHVVMQRLVAPLVGGSADEAVVRDALPLAERALSALQDLAGGQTYLAGDALSLADLYLVPIYDYFAMTPEGRDMLPKFAGLQRWWQAMEPRDSVLGTRPKLG